VAGRFPQRSVHGRALARRHAGQRGDRAPTGRGVSVFEVEGARIRAYRECFDKGVQLVRLGFNPELLARVLGRGVPAVR